MFGVEDRIPLIYGTFSKAFGALGGFVAGSKETVQYLRFYAHPYVYSCALPAVVVAAILKALDIGTSEWNLQKQLWENAEYFHKQLRGLGIDTGRSTTYIMPIVIGDRERMYRLGHQLRRRGLWVAPVDYPAVPQNKICFRACVTANHTRADLECLENRRYHHGRKCARVNVGMRIETQVLDCLFASGNESAERSKCF